MLYIFVLCSIYVLWTRRTTCNLVLLQGNPFFYCLDHIWVHLLCIVSCWSCTMNKRERSKMLFLSRHTYLHWNSIELRHLSLSSMQIQDNVMLWCKQEVRFRTTTVVGCQCQKTIKPIPVTARCCIQSCSKNRPMKNFLRRELNIRMHPTPELPTAGWIIGPNICPQTWRQF